MNKRTTPDRDGKRAAGHSTPCDLAEPTGVKDRFGGASQPWVCALFRLHESFVTPARAAGQVSVKTFSQQAKVTPQISRNGPNGLNEARMLTRARRDATLSSGTKNAAYAAQQVLAAADRRCLAAAVCVPEVTSLFIGSGTIAVEFARSLRARNRNG